MSDPDTNFYQYETGVASEFRPADDLRPGMFAEVVFSQWFAGKEAIPRIAAVHVARVNKGSVVLWTPDETLVEDGVGLDRHVTIPKSQIVEAYRVRRFQFARLWGALKPSGLDEDMLDFLRNRVARDGYIKFRDVMRFGLPSIEAAKVLVFLGFERSVERIRGVQQRVWRRAQRGVTPAIHLFSRLLGFSGMVEVAGRREWPSGCHTLTLRRLRDLVDQERERRRGVNRRRTRREGQGYESESYVDRLRIIG